MLGSYQWDALKRPVFEFDGHSAAGSAYFNSGVMLIDVEAWQAFEVVRKIGEVAEKNPPRFTGDQGLLNLVLRDNWAEMHPTWNWHHTRNRHALFSLMRPQIIHFAGFEKPWDVDGQALVHEPQLVAGYRQFMALNFPQMPRTTGSIGEKDRRLRQVFKELGKTGTQIWAYRKLLSRFGDRYQFLGD